MIKIISILVFTIICNISFAQVDEGTNPLAPTLPVPIYHEPSETNEERVIREYNELAEKRKAENLNTVNEREVEYSDNVLNSLHERDNPSPLAPFEDKKLKFNDFHENEFSPTPVKEESQNTEAGYWVLGSLGALLLIVFCFVFFINKTPSLPDIASPTNIKQNQNIEDFFIKTVKKATAEIENILKDERFATNKYLNFNILCFCYFIEKIQLIQYSKTNSKFSFDEEKFWVFFLDEIESSFKNLNPNKKELNHIFAFANEQIHIGLWSSNYISMIEALLSHKGMLRSEIESTIYQLETEFKNVITAFRDASNGNGKYKLPYKSYIAFFLFPITFLEDENGVIENLHEDFFDEIVRFLPVYVKLGNHIQQFLALENLIIFKEKKLV